MSILTVFEFEGQRVRFVGTGADIQFRAKDVAEVLQIEEAQQYLLSLSTKERSNSYYTPFDMLAMSLREKDEDKAQKIIQFVRRFAGDSATVMNLSCAAVMWKVAFSCETRESETQPSVYLIGCKENQSLKIGYSQSVRKRLRNMQTSSPFKLELINSIPGSPSLERKLHKEFSSLKLSGEWFVWNESILQRFEYLSALAD